MSTARKLDNYKEPRQPSDAEVLSIYDSFSADSQRECDEKRGNVTSLLSGGAQQRINRRKRLRGLL